MASIEDVRARVASQKALLPEFYGRVDFDATPERFTEDAAHAVARDRSPLGVQVTQDDLDRVRAYTLLGDILEFLVNRAAVFQSDALPGAWDRKAGTYTVTEASRAAVQTFLNVSPTEGQASSASEP